MGIVMKRDLLIAIPVGAFLAVGLWGWLILLIAFVGGPAQ
jgi:hypothetical protein